MTGAKTAAVPAGPSKSVHKKGIAVDPTLNFALTAIFFALVVGSFGSLAVGNLPPACPLGPSAATAALAGACILVFPAIFLVKTISGAVFKVVSRVFLRHVGDPLAKPKNLHKFQDQMWQLAIHVGMTALEVHILYYEGGGEPWLESPHTLWQPMADGLRPRDLPPSGGAGCARYQRNKPSVHLLYLLQMAVWIVTCASHRFLEERHKDYFMMYAHHLVTIGLVWSSYSMNYVRVGTVVLLLHDSSDIVADLLKLANYLKLEGSKGLFLVEALFLGNLASWAYTRLYLYPLRVLWQGVWKGSREVCFFPTAPGMEGFYSQTSFVDAGFPNGKQTRLGDGSFDLVQNWLALPAHPNLPLYWASGTLLTALLVMHILWYLMFWRILVRLLSAEDAHNAGREEYEGDSDDDDKED
jgi:hypothetical protein